jgi:light-independent protochlorophyllide reductase B subunit
MYLLILFLIILLIILIYNNSKIKYIENYTPKDYSRSIDVRLCKEESVDILTPEYDREFNLNELQEIIKEANNEEENIIRTEKNIIRKDNEEEPDLIVLTPTCTSSILQEDLQNFVNRAASTSKSDVILADVNHYRVNELQAADRTLEQIIIFYIEKAKKHDTINLSKTVKPSVNIIGPSCLGFHNQHDLMELKCLFQDLKIDINLIVPDNCLVSDLKNLPKAWINIIPYNLKFNT